MHRLLAISSATAQYPVAGLTATGRSLTIAAGSAWKVFIPDTYVPRAGSVADVLVLLHGDPQTVWNNAKWANLNTIIVTANYGAASSAYQTPFSTNTTLFQTVLDQALAKVRLESDIPDNLQWDQFAARSFSAGYGGVREILKNATYRDNIDALLAADSLYATTAGDGTPLDSQMVDYKTFALAAKNGQKTFLLSHSKVLTFTYENTAETADELMQYLEYHPDQLFRYRSWYTQLLPKSSDRQFPHVGRQWRHRATTTRLTSATSATSSKNSPSPNLSPATSMSTVRSTPPTTSLWRKKNGGGALPNDGGITPGVTNAADYTYWRSRYAAAFIPAINTGEGLSNSTSIPEPASSTLVGCALIAAITCLSSHRTRLGRTAATQNELARTANDG